MRSVRWDNLKVETEGRRTLPGYREPAAIRTFEAPEAMNVRFYEVQAKSILNRVPKASRMPFRWTINPYRGCTHSCTYCLDGGTRILMGDGRTKALADVRTGDHVYGTVERGRFRRYVVTEVLDHWQSLKPAFRVVLADGTELIASGDHRFLTSRGWKHVTGRRGPRGRPYLTTSTKLMGTGEFTPAPASSADYRRGYLCGLIRGDGADRQRHVLRVRPTDLEPLRRARDYIAERGIAMRECGNYERRVGHKPSTSIQTSVREDIARIADLIAWPREATDSWCKGFLAGIFDAEGCHSRGIILIANTDPALIDWTAWCMRRLGFSFRIEKTARDNGLAYVRLTGGLREVLRFLHCVDPAISRKRAIEGMALKSNAPLQVRVVEPLDLEMPLYDITTGTGDFIANGVVSHNCFARPTHTYLDFNAREDFEREIVVKVNTPEVARAELMRPRWTREHVALGTNTDPYQWVEKQYELLPGVWEAMRDSRTPCSVLTKSPLLLRDIELFKQIPSFAANLSIPTLDERAWRASEPHTPHPRKRIEAVAELNRAGIPTGVLIAPLMPGINDSPEQVEEILELCAEAGAVSIGGICLHLRGEVRDIVMDWLRSYRPDLVPRYESLYAGGAYAPKAERERISRLVREGRRVTRPSRDTAGDAEPELAAPPPEQPSLF
jgi:DNA repair photolyase